MAVHASQFLVSPHSLDTERQGWAVNWGKSRTGEGCGGERYPLGRKGVLTAVDDRLNGHADTNDGGIELTIHCTRQLQLSASRYRRYSRVHG